MKNYLLILLTILSIQSYGQAINLDPSDTVDYVEGTAINLDLRYSPATVNYAPLTSTEPALNFVGANYIIVPSNDSLSFPHYSNDTAFYVSFWARLTNNDQGFFIKSGEYRSYLAAANDKILFDVLDSTSGFRGRETNSIAAYYDSWHHYVMTYNGSEACSGIDIYIDKVIKDAGDRSSGTANGMPKSASAFWIGRYSTSYSKCLMAGFRIGRGFATQAVVDSLYNNAVLGNDRAIWPMTEGHGTFIHNVTNNNINYNGIITADASWNSWDSTQTVWKYNYNYGYTTIDTLVFPNLTSGNTYFTILSGDIMAGQSNSLGLGDYATANDSLKGYCNTIYAYDNISKLQRYLSSTFRNSTTYIAYDAAMAKIYNTLGKERFFIKYAETNTSLAQKTGNDWYPTSTGEDFATLKTHYTNGLKAIMLNGRIPYISSFQWVQGETDAATLAYANAYLTNLTYLKDTIADNLGDNIRWEVVRLSNKLSSTYLTTIQTAQNTFGTNYSYSDIISTDDYNFIADNLHYNTTSLGVLARTLYTNTNGVTGINYLPKLFPSGYTIVNYVGNKF